MAAKKRMPKEERYMCMRCDIVFVSLSGPEMFCPHCDLFLTARAEKLPASLAPGPAQEKK